MFGTYCLHILHNSRRYIVTTSFIFSLFTIYLLIFNVHKNTKDDLQTPVQVCKHMPVVKIHGTSENENILDVVTNMFQRMGYRVRFDDLLEWDILWSYTYPFHEMSNKLTNLKSSKKVNHFPGSGYITQKSSLATLRMRNIPKSFVLPNDKEYFLQYATENKNMVWLLKSSSHRGLVLINGTIDLEVKGSFVQEFIQNPFLISGKKFDIGVYVMLTSIDPLRVYVYSEDILLRFCKKNYFPFNAEDPDSYIVGDDYLPVWEVEDLKFYFSQLNYTAKETLNAFLISKGKRTKDLWAQIHESIQNVYLQNEENLKKSSMSLGSLRNFFELVRFDYMVDDNLKVFLLEANMSPNLSPAHFSQNRLLYEQIVFNSLSIAGLVRKIHDSFIYRGEAEVSEKDIQVFSEQCSSQTCQASCRSFKCSICNQCMNNEMKEIAKHSYIEFINRGKYRRILPAPTVGPSGEPRYVKIAPSTAMNAFMDLWFKGKCLQDIAWCQ